MSKGNSKPSINLAVGMRETHASAPQLDEDAISQQNTQFQAAIALGERSLIRQAQIKAATQERGAALHGFYFTLATVLPGMLEAGNRVAEAEMAYHGHQAAAIDIELSAIESNLATVRAQYEDWKARVETARKGVRDPNLIVVPQFGGLQH